MNPIRLVLNMNPQKQYIQYLTSFFLRGYSNLILREWDSCDCNSACLKWRLDASPSNPNLAIVSPSFQSVSCPLPHSKKIRARSISKSCSPPHPWVLSSQHLWTWSEWLGRQPTAHLIHKYPQRHENPLKLEPSDAHVLTRFLQLKDLTTTHGLPRDRKASTPGGTHGTKSLRMAS